MYKITSHLANKRLVLIRHPTNEGPCALLLLHKFVRSQQSGPALNESVPETPKRSGAAKYVFAAVGIGLFSGAVVLAKKNEDVRNYLAKNAPWADNIVAVVYEENMPLTKWIKSKVGLDSGYIAELIFGKEEIVTNAIQKPKSASMSEPSLMPIDFKTKSAQPEEKSVTVSVSRKEKVPSAQTSTPVSLPPTKDATNLDKSLHEHSTKAIDGYKRATDACKNYYKDLVQVVNASIYELDTKMFNKLKNARLRRDEQVSAAEKAAKEALLVIEGLLRRVDTNELEASVEDIAKIKRSAVTLKQQVLAAKEGYEKERDTALTSDKYWDKALEARNAYMEQIESLFPSSDPTHPTKISLTADDMDLLLMHTLRQVLFLQNQLAEAQTLREQKLNQALESRDDRQLIEAKAEELFKKEKMHLDQEYNKKLLKLAAEHEMKMKEMLKTQLVAFDDQLKMKLDQKEKEIAAVVHAKASEELEKERVKFKAELAEVTGKLKGIEAALKARAQGDAMARRSQSLWSAAEALLSAARGNSTHVRVDKELRAIEAAAGDDTLVKILLKGVPPIVKAEGLITEIYLKEMYNKMEKTALKVALVGKEGASLPVYVLSWLQSFLMFIKVSDIPKEELENKPTDFSKLDTYEILQRARYWVERGEISNALRYVNLLDGASRAAASAWCEAARAHLETCQAAQAVMAHAAASGLLYL